MADTENVTKQKTGVYFLPASAFVFILKEKHNIEIIEKTNLSNFSKPFFRFNKNNKWNQ